MTRRGSMTDSFPASFEVEIDRPRLTNYLRAQWLLGWMLNTIFPAPTGTSVSFQAPALARSAMAPYAVSVSDGKGGSENRGSDYSQSG